MIAKLNAYHQSGFVGNANVEILAFSRWKKGTFVKYLSRDNSARGTLQLMVTDGQAFSRVLNTS